MKKSLLALAVAAALPAVAFAQTNIILNGSIDGSLEYLDSDANGILNPGSTSSDVRVTDGVWSGSRFAISGTEELGGGLKGIFNIEHRLSADTGTVTNPNNVVTQQAGGINQERSQFWAGQSWVGLQGGFGAIRFGRQYTPMFRALAGGDVTGYSWYNNLAGGISVTGAPGGWTLRFANDISYQSPSIAGFTVHAAYAAGEDATAPYDNKLGDAVGLAALGSFGPFNFGVGYHQISSGDAPLLNDAKELGVSLGAKFGNFGLGLAATQTEPFDPAADKRKMFYASASAGLGAGTLYLTFFRDDRGGENIDADGATLTYSHGLSKRTFLYGSAGYNRFEGITATGDDLKPLRVALGVRHFF